MTGKVTLCLLVLTVGLAGCGQIAGAAYMFGIADQTRTAEAAFSGLNHTTVAVVIYADERVQYEYPGATMALSQVISAELRHNGEDIQTVSPLEIQTFQHENLGWEMMDKAELGEALGADHVLFVSLRDYGTREPGSMNIYRGHINGEATIYDAHQPPGAQELWREEYLEVAHPSQGTSAVLADNDYDIRYRTDKAFAQLLVKNFYDHEVPRYQ